MLLWKGSSHKQHRCEGGELAPVVAILGENPGPGTGDSQNPGMSERLTAVCS